MSCGCNESNQFFITSFCIDESKVIIGTNQPITTQVYPFCFKMRLASCTRALECAETLEVYVSVNGKNVPVLNRYGSAMKYGEFRLKYNGCLDRRIDYTSFVSKDGNKDQVLISNAPKYIAR